MFYANGKVVSDAYFMAFRSSVAFICGDIFCEFYLFIFALFCPCVHLSSLLGLQHNYGKHTFPRLNMQKSSSVQTNLTGRFHQRIRSRMSKAETLPLAKMAQSEMLHSRSVLRVLFSTGCGEKKHRVGGSDPEC